MPHSARSLHRHLSILVLGLVAMAATGSTARAQFTWATDNAGNYAVSWTNGSDGGTGFGAWGFGVGANSGNFIGNPSNNGMGTTGIGTTAFGLYATGGAYFSGGRAFDSAMQVGDTFTFWWSMNFDANGGGKGFDLKANNTTVFNVNNFNSGAITTTSGTANSNYGTTPMLVTATRTSDSQYAFSMTSRSGGATYSTTISSSAAFDSFNLYIGNQNNGDGERNIYFNNFQLANSGTYNFGGSITESRAMIGGGALTVGGSTTLTLTSAGNTFTGGSTVAAGSELTIGNGGANGSLAGNVANSGRLTFNSSSSLTYAGQLSGSGTFVKSGSGLLTLSGNSAGYAGATLLQSGSLNVSGALGGTVEVSSGAVLVGALSVASGKALGGSGTIDGNVSLAANAAFVFDPAETLTVQNGTVSFGGFGVDDILGLDQNTPDGIYTLIAGAVNLANVSNVGAGSAYSLGGGKSAYLQAGSLQLVVVPEPPAVIAVVGGLAGVAAYGFRRRRRA